MEILAKHFKAFPWEMQIKEKKKSQIEENRDTHFYGFSDIILRSFQVNLRVGRFWVELNMNVGMMKKEIRKEEKYNFKGLMASLKFLTYEEYFFPENITLC